MSFLLCFIIIIICFLDFVEVFMFYSFLLTFFVTFFLKVFKGCFKDQKNISRVLYDILMDFFETHPKGFLWFVLGFLKGIF